MKNNNDKGNMTNQNYENGLTSATDPDASDEKKKKRHACMPAPFTCGCLLFFGIPIALSAFFGLYGAQIGQVLSNITATIEATPIP
ncbi:MAG: hypothetical protein AAF490_21885 [Chloroflexota bacterium]